jgi:hypothetical protein
VLGGALLLAWPALLNGYPILFSDTNAFLVQASRPWMIWDKPYVYGPILELFHGFTTLWLPLAAQVLVLSLMLHLVARTVAPGATGVAGLMPLLLAVGSAAPWVASLLMPDMFAPLVVLGLFLAAFAGTRAVRRAGAAVATLAIAVHLSHLLIAAACLAVLLVLRPRRAGASAVPLSIALGLLVTTNVAGYGRVAVSPFGSVFYAARLVADGPARAELDAECPRPGWSLCDWRGRLPADSDAFLWSPTGPVWGRPGGPRALAPEAASLVWRTLLDRPGALAVSATRDTLAQLGEVRLGDTLGAAALGTSVARGIARYFPANEQARFAAGLQNRDRLRGWAVTLNPLHTALLIAAGLATPVLLIRALRRRDDAMAGLAALVIAGVIANAAATGALSGPHDRYQARIAWLVLVPPWLAAAQAIRSARVPPPRPAPSAPAPRNPAAASPSPGPA